MNKFSKFICTTMLTLLLSLSFSTLIVNAEDVLTATTNQTTVASGATTNGPAYDDDEMK